MEIKDLAISIQPKINGKKVLLMAWINMGTHNTVVDNRLVISSRGVNAPIRNQNRIGVPLKVYERVIVSTGISIPVRTFILYYLFKKKDDPMKMTELFVKKLNMLFGMGYPEEREFLEKYIYKGPTPEGGLTVHQMKRYIPEILGYGIKIIGIETYNKKGFVDALAWEQFEKFYTNEWLAKAIDKI